jgi:membrane associated rhomboid family serine protease
VIPLYDRNRTRRLPVVTIVLIAANVLVFFYQLKVDATQGDAALNSLIDEYGVKPSCTIGFLAGKRELVLETRVKRWYFGYVETYVESIPLTAKTCLLPLLTSLFLHAGWMHLLGNMWFLWVFGDNVEDRLGRLRFLIFYIACGVFASLIHSVVSVVFAGGSVIPTIGASGAVSGVLGAYFIAFPRARVVTLLPVFFFFYLVEIPASLYLLFWFFVQQVLPGLGSLGHMGSGGVAFWAHIGGFAAGIAYMYRSRQP